MVSSDDEDAALLDALAPTEQERTLLVSVSDAALQDKLLLLLLRAEVGIPVGVYVCPSMHKSDSFQNFDIAKAVNEEYVAAMIERKREQPPHFVLRCPSNPHMDMEYDGQDVVQDKLIEFFCKDLIRFEMKEVSWSQPHCACSATP